MRLFAGTVARFSDEIASGNIVPLLEQAFSEQMLSRPNPSEVTSWANSLPVLQEDLVRANLAEAGIVLEYMLPLSSKRLDAVILGRDSNGKARATVIELKQWRQAEITSVEDRLINMHGTLTLHPQQQVAQYVLYLRDFHTLVDKQKLLIDGGAYLHNADLNDARSMQLSYLSDLKEFPLFTRDDRSDLQKFLYDRAGAGDGEQVLGDYLDAPLRPSKKLLDHVALEIEGHPMFHLLDEQFVAFELVKRAVQQSLSTSKKTVILVRGGPGTGKSVIAARIIGEMAKRGLNVSHATGSRSFTETLRKTVGRRGAPLFRYFNSFAMADANEIDVLVCDEAHRIRASSNSRFTRAANRSNLPQVDELIQVAKTPVFLLDQDQVVRPQEIGTAEVIQDAARRNAADLVEVDLNGQFRCMGSDAYVQWVDRLLGLVPGSPVPWDGHDPFSLGLADSPSAMEQWLRERHGQRYTARMTAGYCWVWSDPDPDGYLVDDIEIGSWRRPWNARPGKKTKDAPAASYWATDARGFDQVGCIYTAQGFEYDYGGVIMGADLVWRHDRWQSNSAEHADTITRKARNFDELVRHIYKVLLTRSLRGCAVYSVDEETQEFLSDLIPCRV
jgi:uncharacterized protein